MLQDLTESDDLRVKHLVRALEKELPASYEATITKGASGFRIEVQGTFAYTIPEEGVEYPNMAADIAGRALREMVKGAKR